MTHHDFVTVDRGRLVDATGRSVHLRGMGLGNWLLAEGYMWKLSPGCESAREIEALVIDLVGAERADDFWRSFRDRFVARADIERMARDGFDHVRLPINWRVVMHDDGELRADGFTRIDDLIGWCQDAGMRVLLDLHGAPGGQTGTNIDDSMGRPELFMQEHYVELTERLWVAIAERYRDEPTVLGYDLLNEPLPNEWQDRFADELIQLYQRLTEAIRSVDDRHILMYEGSHWATNWSIFTEVWDPNAVLQFHKYWSPPDRPSIQRFIDVGERLGLPIYMGEGGENNTDWLATAFQMYDDLGIGWNFWPWKKIDTRTSPCSIDAPAGWADIVAYANDAGPRPDPDVAWSTLTALVEAAGIDACTIHDEVVRALFRRVPVSLPATAFGFDGVGRSHSPTAPPARPLGFRDDDGVAITTVADTPLPAFDRTDGRPDDDFVVTLRAGEWVTYSIEADGGAVDLTALTDRSAPPIVTFDDQPAVLCSSDGDRYRYRSPDLRAGRTAVRVTADDGGCRLRRLTFDVIA